MPLAGLVTALRTLTRLPVPGREAEHLGAALPWFPVVGALVGALTVGAGELVLRGHASLEAVVQGRGTAWPGAAAFCMLVTGVLVTGALHLDGLADSADGLGGGRNRERALAIMKDSRTGAFGVLALVLVLLGKFAAYGRLLETGHLVWIIAACILARAAQVFLAASQPYARETGTAGAFVRQANWRHAAGAGVGAVALVTAVCGFGLAVPVMAALACGVSAAWGMWCRKRLGGVTGDTLGAGSELVELAVLFAAGWM